MLYLEQFPGAAPGSEDEDELYDEGVTVPESTSHDESGETEELYDEASTQDNQDTKVDPYQDDDEMYETYDDILAADAKEDKIIPPAATRSLPPPTLPERNNPNCLLRDKSQKSSPALPPRNEPTAAEENSDGVGNYFESLYYGVWDCAGDAENELTFSRGDVIQILSKTHCGTEWWVGKLDDKVGIVPCEYLSATYEIVR